MMMIRSGGGGGSKSMTLLGASSTTAAGGGGSQLNTITPCAACKLLRRRCAQECPFSPYFSPHDPHKFASVHKVFGASNVSKLLSEVPESQRADAANSLVYEANVRLRDPVYGCMGAISALQQQVQTLQSELNTVMAEILKYRYREASCGTMIPNSSASHVTLLSSDTGGGSTAVTVATPAPTPPSHHHQPPPPLPLPPELLPPPDTSSSSIFTQPSATTTATDFITISSENISYFS